VPTTAPVFEAAAALDRPKGEGTEEPPGPLRRYAGGRPVVVIDPGHGGIDSGAVGKDGLLEKDLTLRFALELARQLKAGGKVEPVLTRDKDDTLALTERVEIAERHKAALLISIHADSVKQDYVRGATVYTLSEDASDAVAAEFAERENRADILAGFSLDPKADDLVKKIVGDYIQSDIQRQSAWFANSLVSGLNGSIALNSKPLRRGAFVVLKGDIVPSVLFEIGYLSNKDDEAMFRAEGWPRSEAESTARAIESFLGNDMTAGQ